MLKENNQHIVIGSSPTMLALALRLAKKGYQTVVVEKSNCIGGAWALQTVFEKYKIAPACYLMNQDFRAYSLMEKQLGWHMKSLDPQPLYVFKGKKYPYYTLKRVILGIIEPIWVGKYSFNPSVADDWNNAGSWWKEAKEFIQTAWQLVLSFFLKQVKFPSNGAQEIISVFRTKAKLLGIKTLYDHKVIKIDISPQGVCLYFSNGQHIKGKRVYTSRGSEVPIITLENKTVEVGSQERKFPVLYLLFHDKGPSLISYVWYAFHECINRIDEPIDGREVLRNQGKRLFVVQLKNRALLSKSRDEIVAESLKEIKSQGFINTHATFEKYQFSEVSASKMLNPKSIVNMKSPNVCYIHTPHITRGILEVFRASI